MYEEQFMLLYFSSALGEKTASLLPTWGFPQRRKFCPVLETNNNLSIKYVEGKGGSHIFIEYIQSTNNVVSQKRKVLPP